MAGALGKAVLPEPAGEKVEQFADGYAAVTPLVDAVATTAAGGKADWVKTGATVVVKEGVSVVTHSQGAQLLTKTTVVKVEIVTGAMNHDEEGVIKSAVSYIYDLNTTAAEMTGKKGKAGAALAKIAKSAFEYNEQIGKAFDELIDNDLDSMERVDALKRNIGQMVRRLSRQIFEMEQFITSCEYELTDPQPLV